MKICSKCGIEKPLTEFYRKAINTSGLHSDCKACNRKYYAAKREFDRLNNPTPEQARAILNQELAKNGQKQCFECEIVKPLFEFTKVSRNKDGLQGVCRQCRKPRSTVANKKCRKANPDKHRVNAYRTRLKVSYNLTPEEKKTLEQRQNGCCAVCGDLLPSQFHSHVDHIHGSNPVIVRGILCQQCNIGLGNFKDSPERLLKAAAYLKKFQNNT